ncbi:MAG: mechanosensitive ion channel [Rhodothermales bacterium]|nr:mechanosensitive ion channel [Rhodothermales bacterium]
MGPRTHVFSLLVTLILAACLSGCRFFGGGSEGPEGVAADSLAADSMLVAVPADSLGAMVDSLMASPGAPDAAAPAGDNQLSAPETDFAVVPPTVVLPATAVLPASGSISADSLSESLAALLMQRLQRGFTDTVVVRIDTARAATPDSVANKPVEQLQEGLKNVGTRVFFAILIIIGAFYLLQGLLWLLEAIADRSATRRLFFKRLIPIVRMVMWAIVIWFIMTSVFQVDRNGLLAASAALGVGIGLAAQDLIKNLLGGIIIIFDAPFQVGDKVQVGNSYGEVKSIGLRSTRIVTLDDNLVSVPNSQVVDSQVANANAGVLDCQVVTTLYLPGWVDPAKAKSIAYQAAANSRFVYLDKPIVVHIRDEFKETFLMKISVKAYVLDHLYESALATDITETAKLGFLKAGLLYPVYGLTPPAELVASMAPGPGSVRQSLGIPGDDEASDASDGDGPKDA